MVLTFITFNSILIVIIPQLFILILLYYSYINKQSKDIHTKEVHNNDNNSTDNDNNTIDYYLNLQSIQNFMGLTVDLIDNFKPVHQIFNWSNYNKSSLIFKLNFYLLLTNLVIFKYINIKYILLLSYYGLLFYTNPNNKLILNYLRSTQQLFCIFN